MWSLFVENHQNFPCTHEELLLWILFNSIGQKLNVMTLIINAYFSVQMRLLPKFEVFPLWTDVGTYTGRAFN